MVLDKMSKVMGDVFKQEEDAHRQEAGVADEGEATLHSAASNGERPACAF